MSVCVFAIYSSSIWQSDVAEVSFFPYTVLLHTRTFLQWKVLG